MLENFDEGDTNNDGRLSINEAQAIIPNLTQAQFDQLDINSNGFLSEDELRSIGNEGCGCFRGCTPSNTKSLVNWVTDWLLVGLSLMVLLGVARVQNRP